MCSGLKEMFKPVCIRQYCDNYRLRSTSSASQRPPNIWRELSEKWILNIRVLKVIITWSWGVGVKTGRSGSTNPTLRLHAPYSFHIYTELYQKRRLNGSSDELPGFVLWRKCTGHNLSQGFSFLQRIMLLLYHFWSHNDPFVLSFFFLPNFFNKSS